MRKKESKPLTPRQKFWQKVFFIGSVVILVISILISAVVIFQKTYFTPFWVNGQSMYPYLNLAAKYSDGEYIGDDKDPGRDDGIYDVDYGFMDTHKWAIDRIERFDIVVFENGSGISYNIKRVIALPGETFYITSSEDDNQNGKLYVLNPSTSEFEFIEQPVASIYVRKGDYPETYTVPTTLKEDEYFVMGDNRLEGHSYDSRISGPIHRDVLEGVALALNGSCTLGIKKDGKYGPVKVKHYWPRFFK